MRRDRLSLVLLVALAAGCGAPMTRVEQRRAAIDGLEDPRRRSASLLTLGRIALVHDGDPERADAWLSELPLDRTGEAWALAALIAAARGDLRAEIDGWVRAIEGGDAAARTLALVRLLDLADYVPRATVGRIRDASARLPGELSAAAGDLVSALKRAPRPTVRADVALVPEPWPLSAFADGRSAPEDAPGRKRSIVDGELALGNAEPSLARIRVFVPASPQGRWLRVESTDAVRVMAGPTVAWVRDPSAAVTAEIGDVWLAPSRRPTRIRLFVAAREASARIGIRWVEGPAPLSPVTAGTPASPAWLDTLARAELAAHRGDRDAVLGLEASLEAAVPGLAERHLLAARFAADARVAERLARGGTRHAGVVRAVAARAHLDGRESLATERLEALGRVADPRSALVRFRILNDRGWEADAQAALAHARELAPEACEPAKEELQHYWERLKLARADPARDVLPVGCARLAALAPVVAQFAGETGRVDHAERMLSGIASRSGDARAFGPARVRLLERLGRQRESVRLAERLADGLDREVEPWFRVGDLRASLGGRAKAQAAWARADRIGAAELESRLKLMAVGAGRIWERFRPDVDVLLSEEVPDELSEGHPAVLLIDHKTTVRFRDGAAVHYVHQVMRLQTDSAVADLGEVALPADAVIVRAATRKASGAILEPEDIAQKDTLSFPELEVGDVIELAYLTGSAAEQGLDGGWIEEPFYFGLFEVSTWRSSYVVLLQEGVRGRWDASGDVAPPRSVDGGGYHGWRWVGEPVVAFRPEPVAVSPFDSLPVVRVWSGLGWDVLERQARERLLGLVAPDRILRDRVARLAVADMEPWGVARELYAWVRDGVEEDQEAWLSVPASTAIATGRGEKVVALIGLLRVAGFDADLALVDPVHREHAPRAVPDVRDFSYLAVRVRRRGDPRTVWLDPSFRGAPFGFLPPTIRARPARIVGVAGVGEVATTPLRPAMDERRTLRIDLELGSDGGLTGSWVEVARGMDGLTWREALEPMTGPQRKRALAALAQEVLPGVRVTAMRVDDLGAVDRPVRIELALARDPDGRAGIEPLRLGLGPVYLAQRWIHTESRKTALYADRHEDLDLTITVRLPEGVQPVEVPDDVRREGRFGQYLRTARYEDGLLELHKRLELRPQVVPARGYSVFSAFCRAVDAADRVVIKLR